MPECLTSDGERVRRRMEGLADGMDERELSDEHAPSRPKQQQLNHPNIQPSHRRISSHAISLSSSRTSLHL